jgi:hypothetical protein
VVEYPPNTSPMAYSAKLVSLPDLLTRDWGAKSREGLITILCGQNTPVSNAIERRDFVVPSTGSNLENDIGVAATEIGRSRACPA